METPRTKNIFATALVLVTVSLLASCESTESPTGAGGPPPADLWEAERAALMLGEDPSRAPVLTANIARDLEHIRARHAWMPEMDAYRVYSPWYADQLAVIPTEEARERLGSGDEWPEFDAVAASLGVVGRKWCGRYAILLLAERHNPCGLRGRFNGVEGILAVEPVWHIYTCPAPGACHFIWPQFLGAGMAYLFQWRQDGHSIYAYFRSEFGIPHLVGIYDTERNPTPSWWSEIDPPGFDHTCPD